MSRIGNTPIQIPDGVQISVDGDMTVTVKGSKGENRVTTKKNVKVRQEDSKLIVDRLSDKPQDKAFHGLYHRLITNAITGVTQGYKKELEIQGVGYKADMQGPKLVLNVGFSHSVEYVGAPGVQIEVPDPTKVIITGIDKELVHRTAADIRLVNPPEPYKGKGIRYKGEEVKRKVGKTGAK